MPTPENDKPGAKNPAVRLAFGVFEPLPKVPDHPRLEVEILAPLGSIDYWFAVPGERVHKAVHFFLMRSTGGDVSRHDHEYDQVRWVSADEARRLLSFRTYHEVLDRALDAAREAA